MLKTVGLGEYVVARRRDWLGVDWLERAFPELLKYGFTARLAEQLDRIAAGGADRKRPPDVFDKESRKRLSAASDVAAGGCGRDRQGEGRQSHRRVRGDGRRLVHGSAVREFGGSLGSRLALPAGVPANRCALVGGECQDLPDGGQSYVGVFDAAEGDRLVVSELSRLGQVVTILDALAKAGVALVALKENFRVEGKQGHPDEGQ